MTSLQGRARGMMECWYTSAERQPGEGGKMVSTGLGTWVFPGVRSFLICVDGNRIFGVVLHCCFNAPCSISS